MESLPLSIIVPTKAEPSRRRLGCETIKVAIATFRHRERSREGSPQWQPARIDGDDPAQNLISPKHISGRYEAAVAPDKFHALSLLHLLPEAEEARTALGRISKHP